MRSGLASPCWPILLALGLAACGAPPVSTPDPRPPDLILIVIDTLRADAVGAWGNPRGLTPTLDELAAEGVVFERAVAAAPWTQPSMASLFSSVDPGVHGVVSYFEAFDAVYRGAPKVAALDEAFVTLAESLRDRGYQTAAFVANPFLDPAFGFAQGFDHYDASFARNTTPGDVVNDAALDWLAARDDPRPLFLWVHYMDVHGPYDAGPEDLDPLLASVEGNPDLHRLSPAELERLDYLDRPPPGPDEAARYEALRPFREYWVARYEAGVRRADRQLADLRRRLRSLGMWDRACVVVLADHGEALCEQGLWEHGLSQHDTDLHVPLILRRPGGPAGVRRAQTVRMIDVMPTLLEQAGAALPANLEGRSLVPLIDDAQGLAPLPAFAEALSGGPEQKALYDGSWKLMLRIDDGAVALYDLARDPMEDSNLAEIEPERAMRMRSAIVERVEADREHPLSLRARGIELSPEQVERLRSLGYLP